MSETTNGELLSRSQLLALSKRRYALHDIAGYGQVRIQSLTELERSRFEASFIGDGAEHNAERLVRAKVKLIAACLVDEDGLLLFRESDEAGLLGVDSAITNHLFDLCQEHCGFTSSDVAALVGNSNSSQNGSAAA